MNLNLTGCVIAELCPTCRTRRQKTLWRPSASNSILKYVICPNVANEETCEDLLDDYRFVSMDWAFSSLHSEADAPTCFLQLHRHHITLILRCNTDGTAASVHFHFQRLISLVIVSVASYMKWWESHFIDHVFCWWTNNHFWDIILQYESCFFLKKNWIDNFV